MCQVYNRQIYGHPFSSYTQKALTALYENDTPFEFLNLSPDDPDIYAEFARRWPIRKFPLLVEGDRQVMEATSIIEYLDVHHPGPTRLIPADADAAVEVRMLDRFFDNYINGPQQRIVFNQLRPEADRDPYGVNEARTALETAYAWLDKYMAGREWARATASASPTAPPLHRCSTPTGRTGSMGDSATCTRIAHVC